MWLFDTFCTSFYGSPLWSLDEKICDTFIITWRKCIKRVWDIPMRTRSKYLAPLIGKPDIKDQLLLRFSKFLDNCMKSSNCLVSTISRLLVHSSSTVGENVRKLMFKLNMSTYHLYEHINISLHNTLHKIYNREHFDEVNIIHELCRVKDGTFITNLSRGEAKELLEFICTL